MGKWIVIAGVFLVAAGAIVWLLESLGLPLGRLPGDINFRGRNWAVSIPWVTCIVGSVVLTILLNFLLRFFR